MWILDQFRIVKSLSAGGMGQVYLAEQPSMERYAAVKILRGKTLAEERQHRFRREARTISRLAHPNIVSVYNFGELADGTLFLAMEYVEGKSLSDILEDGALPVMRAINLTYQCAAALGYAHSRQVVHRDIKPGNLMVAKLLGRDHIKVLDFGIALLQEDESHSTQPGTILGTPEYLSPEQCRGGEVTSFSDQYSLGHVFYEMLTGQRVFESATAIGYLDMHQHATPRAPSELRPDAAVRSLDSSVLRMISKSPTDRFSSMDELQQVLSRAAELALRPVQWEAGAHPGTAGVDAKAGHPPLPAPANLPGALTSRGPAQVLFLGSSDNAVSHGRWETLRRNGIQPHVQADHSTGQPLRPNDQPPDLWVLGVLKDNWEVSWQQWRKVGLVPHRTLLCVDAPVESPGLTALSGSGSSIMIGPFPVEPMALALALRWMHHDDIGTVESLVSGRSVQVLQLTSSTQKSAHVDLLLEDLRAEGIRQPARQALKELSEEMIMNSVFHAPVDAHGRRQNSQLDRASAVTLPPGHDVILRWVIAERFVAFSARDSYGSLTPEDILAVATGPSVQPANKRSRGGAGLGLRIMMRAATHLFFFISPGISCEVVALVAREVGTTATRGHSLCVLVGKKPVEKEEQIGSRLWLCRTEHPIATCLKLKGEIDESSDLRSIFSSAGLVRLDLGGVASINSVGIQSWLEAFRERSIDLHLVLEFCSPAMVRQFNTLPLLAATGQIVSILAPYYCPHCTEESMEVLQVEEIQVEEIGKEIAPSRECCKCNRALGFEEDTVSYFAFLHS